MRPLLERRARRPVGRTPRRVASFLTLTLVAAGPSGARALEPEITAETSAQCYDVRSPTGETIVPRRRLTSTLGVAAYDLMGARPWIVPDAAARGQGELLFRARLRYDADYGANPGEANPLDFDRNVPGFSRSPIDLMYGYVEGRRMLGGAFGFRLGRQYTTDALGWWSFDGAMARVTTPLYVAAEVLGGLEVRGGMPLSSPRFERDGVWRGDRSGFDRAAALAFQPNEVAPAFGAALESTGLPWVHSRLAYRRVLNTGSSNVSLFEPRLTEPATFDRTRISQERIGYAIDGSAPTVGGGKAGLAYDLYAARFTSLYASADAFVTKRLTLSADYDYFAPTYDADSIFNFFVSNPMNDLGLRASFEATDTISLAGGGGARLFQAETGPSNASLLPAGDYPSNRTTFDGNGSFSARRRKGLNTQGLRVNALAGHEGHRAGGELFAEHTVWARTVLMGRASLYSWEDRLRPARATESVGLVAGVGYRMSERARTQLEFQLDTNRLVGVRGRMVLWFTVAAR
ncbi:MAG: hypothetical protein IPG50_12015 [Myxococcales bacterium]|nr:hypothetical protein [Myxococcales bacterium]